MKDIFAAALAIMLAAILPSVGNAQSIEDRCNVNWKDMATYRTCVSELTAKEAAPLDHGGSCSAKSCIYKLVCSHTEYRTCTGGGYRLEYKRGAGGFYDIVIRGA
jgi:hypothetical protein